GQATMTPPTLNGRAKKLPFGVDEAEDRSDGHRDGFSVESGLDDSHLVPHARNVLGAVSRSEVEGLSVVKRAPAGTPCHSALVLLGVDDEDARRANGDVVDAGSGSAGCADRGG